jgi:hypothetical protein
LARYEASIQQMAGMLKRGRKEAADPSILPETLENTLAGGIVWIAYQRLVVGEAADQLTALVPEALQFCLSPYVGEKKAVEIATRRHADTRGD